MKARRRQPVPFPRPRAGLIRTLIAYHEAGHAVAAVLLGGRVFVVSIRPNEVCRGCVIAFGGREDAEAEAISSAAGDVAVELYAPGGAAELEAFLARNPQPSPSPAALGAFGLAGRTLPPGDAEHFDAALRRLDPDPAAALALTLKAVDLLMAHWPAVRAIAEDLLALGTVDGGRVAELVNKKGCHALRPG